MNQITLTSVFLESKSELYSKLESLSLPKDYKEIQSIVNNHITRLLSGDNAFKDCTVLTSITIPANVTELGSSIFEGCISLKSVGFEEGNELKSIPSRAFYGCSALLQIAIPANVTEICEDSFAYCAALTSVIIPQEVVTIGNGAFAECASLPYIIIPTSVKMIGMYAFNTYLSNGGTISIYYNGTSGQWSEIQKGEYSCGVVFFYSATQPVDTGYFWHYAEDGVTPQVW